METRHAFHCIFFFFFILILQILSLWHYHMVMWIICHYISHSALMHSVTMLTYLTPCWWQLPRTISLTCGTVSKNAFSPVILNLVFLLKVSCCAATQQSSIDCGANNSSPRNLFRNVMLIWSPSHLPAVFHLHSFTVRHCLSPWH